MSEITILEGDCLEIMKTFEDNQFDLVLTDIPYGTNIHKMNFVTSGAVKAGAAYRSDFSRTSDWDKKPPSYDYIQEIFRVSMNQIIFGGQFIAANLPQTRGWIVWDKRTDAKFDYDFADCEIAWSSYDEPQRIIRYLWSGMLQGDMGNKEKRYHPTQKPLYVLRRILERHPQEKTVLDPFCGSGSTAIACMQAERNCIGIEISEEYCEIARKRVQEERDKMSLFAGIEK